MGLVHPRVPEVRVQDKLNACEVPTAHNGNELVPQAPARAHPMKWRMANGSCQFQLSAIGVRHLSCRGWAPPPRSHILHSVQHTYLKHEPPPPPSAFRTLTS